jgi:hypothetical protein
MIRLLVLIAMLLLAAGTAQGEQAPNKRKVAVLTFTHAQVVSPIQSIFGSSQIAGRYFSDLLAGRLIADGSFRVIDREAITRALTETEPPPGAELPPPPRMTGGLFNLSDRDNTPPPIINKVGMMLDVTPLIRYLEADSIIRGEIVAFGLNEGKKPALMQSVRNSINKGCRHAKAVVGVNAEMIDLTTGEVLASARVKTESQHAGCNPLLPRGFNQNVKSITDSNFATTPLGEAFSQAVAMIAQTFERASPAAPTQNLVQIAGLVADVDTDSITVNVGAMAGVHVGDTLVVTRATRMIKDPKTNSSIRSVEQPIGQISIVSVSPFYAIGHFTGSGKVEVKDNVTNMLEGKTY